MNLKFSKTDYLINWLLVICHLFFIITGTIFKLLHQAYWELFLFLGVFCLLASWIVLFIEMIRNDFSNRLFWIFWMFLLPSVSPVIYLLRREKIYRFYELEPEDYPDLKPLFYEY